VSPSAPALGDTGIFGGHAHGGWTVVPAPGGWNAAPWTRWLATA